MAKSFEEFMKMSKEERISGAIEGMWLETEDSVRTIARNRRTAEIVFDISSEDFDEKLNQLCAKANERYQDMPKWKIALELIEESAASKLADSVLAVGEE